MEKCWRQEENKSVIQLLWLWILNITHRHEESKQNEALGITCRWWCRVRGGCSDIGAVWVQREEVVVGQAAEEPSQAVKSQTGNVEEKMRKFINTCLQDRYDRVGSFLVLTRMTLALWVWRAHHLQREQRHVIRMHEPPQSNQSKSTWRVPKDFFFLIIEKWPEFHPKFKSKAFAKF